MLRTLLISILFAAPLCAQTYVDSLAYGGVGDDTTYGVAVDDQGYSYACGKFDGTVDLQPGSGSFEVTGFFAGYVAAYDASNALQWAQVLEPVNPGDWCIPEMTAVDSSGNVYVTGRFFGAVDFDPSAGQQIENAVDALSNPMNTCGFLLKLDASGAFQWVKIFHGTYSWGVRLSVNDTTVCMAGIYFGTCDLDPGAGTQNATSAGLAPFIATFDSSGNLIWADAYSCGSLALMTKPVLQPNGDCIIAVSYAQSISLGQDATAPVRQSVGNVDLLLVRHDSAGAIVWVKEVQGVSSNVVPNALSQDTVGNLYVVGTVSGDPDFDPAGGSAKLGMAPGGNSFIAKYTSDGDFIWAKGLYAAQNINAFVCTADAAGIVVAGNFMGTIDLNPGNGIATHTMATGAAFALRLDFAGNYQWSRNFGGSTTGTGSSGNLQPTTAVYSIASNGQGDLLLGGLFEGTADFDPSTGTALATAVAARDGWLLWLDDTAASTVPPLQIADATLPTKVVGSTVSATFTAFDGSGSGYEWTIDQGALPPGITGFPASGTPSITVGGTTTAGGSFGFRVRVTDDAGASATRTFVWNVSTPGGEAPPVGAGRATAGCTAAGHSAGLWALLVLIVALGVLRRSRCA
ncbi:MAG: hypothetical protein KDB68_06390 [Planctomycetes bacterium]|nr:hypothetical protein [Planctomycetota bacterium]